MNEREENMAKNKCKKNRGFKRQLKKEMKELMYKVGGLEVEKEHLIRDLRDCERALNGWRRFWQNPTIEYYFEPDPFEECLSICTSLKTPEGLVRGIEGRHRIPKDHTERMLHSALSQAAKEYGLKIAENFVFEKKKIGPDVEFHDEVFFNFPFPFQKVGG
jgi:hypothetical protein